MFALGLSEDIFLLGEIDAVDIPANDLLQGTVKTGYIKILYRQLRIINILSTFGTNLMN